MSELSLDLVATKRLVFKALPEISSQDRRRSWLYIRTNLLPLKCSSEDLLCLYNAVLHFLAAKFFLKFEDLQTYPRLSVERLLESFFRKLDESSKTETLVSIQAVRERLVVDQSLSAKASAKRSRDVNVAYHFQCKFVKGARCLHLRKLMYKYAQSMIAFDGTIQYIPVGKRNIVTGDSDLDIELFFETRKQACKMENCALEAYTNYRMEAPPVIQIEECEHVCAKRVMEKDYNAKVYPHREDNEYLLSPDESRSQATTVLDDEIIEQESIVDRSKSFCLFECAHIEAKLKHTPKDNDSNNLPLPSDWHALFDGKCSFGHPCISIAPPPPTPTKTKKKTACATPGLNGREFVEVDVYFRSPDLAEVYARQLRDATQNRPQVYRVGIFKKDKNQFYRHLLARHNVVVKEWPSVP